MSRPQLPRSIQENPLLRQWVDFSRPGVARVFSAKVEIGQGILTALWQIAAEELRLELSRVEIVSGDTRCCPNESYTAGSMSIEVGGSAVRMACAQALAAIVERAAAMLAVDPARVGAEDGAVMLDGAPAGLDYWQVAAEVDWDRPVTGRFGASAGAGRARYIGKSIARLDLPQKVAGGAFIHDLELPGMLHGRVLRPPAQGARLASFDRAAVERLPGMIKIWQSGDFLALCCEREYQAVKALEALRAAARWIESESPGDRRSWKEMLPTLRSIDSETEAGRPPAQPATRRWSATYSRPPLAHASMGPACAVACFDQDRLTVWSHSQGVFPLRAALAGALAMDESLISVVHTQGAGVYGHNGADDVALDAALLARQLAPRPVRVLWSREDELGWSPVGSPMVVKIEAGLAPDGAIADWSAEIWSATHARRPRSRETVNLLAAAHLEPPIALPEAYESLGGFAGGARNSEPPYDVAHRRVVLHSLPGLPLRTSALRSLGGYANVFAAESFMDELAELAGVDPVRFRLRHLSDPRARRVIETAARMAGWRDDAPRGSGAGAGIGFSRYKNTAAYVAAIACIEAGNQLRVTKVYCAVDAGLVINPDGVRNQIEGGVVQSISWTLKEQLAFDGRRVSARSWEDYPILRFAEVPEVEVELVDSAGERALGVGEAAQGPTAAAVANAVACALDIRIRDLPITREQIIAATV